MAHLLTTSCLMPTELTSYLTQLLLFSLCLFRVYIQTQAAPLGRKQPPHLFLLLYRLNLIFPWIAGHRLTLHICVLPSAEQNLNQMC